MDAECKRRRDLQSRREKRWSMNSQRLEEIVAELMKPISDLRRNFDTDLSALLEEYLTEAGLHALDESSDEEGSGERLAGAAGAVAPNFAELALLLQQSASIYGRKVDFLYQHVLSVSDSLHCNTQEEHHAADEPQTPSSGRRKRKSSVLREFTAIEPEAAAAARREAGAGRPPPTLPRLYLELEPRVLGERDAPLRDYDGEPIGLLADFHVVWRLQDGVLVDELQGEAGAAGEARAAGAALRAAPLAALQAAIEAAAPPPLPPPSPLAPPPAPAPAADVAVAAHAPRGKRKRDNVVATFDGCVDLKIDADVKRKLQRLEEFSVPRAWIDKVVSARAAAIRRARGPAPAARDHELCGFYNLLHLSDVGGFQGWSCSEALAAVVAAKVAPAESDDDGFFERSSLGDSDASRADDSPAGAREPRGWECARAWARRAAGADAALDVRALAAGVLAALAPPPAATPFPAVLRAAAPAAPPAPAAPAADVSKLFLATLFLANAGNVEIVRGAPLTLNSFSLRLLSRDERLLTAAARAPV